MGPQRLSVAEVGPPISRLAPHERALSLSASPGVPTPEGRRIREKGILAYLDDAGERFSAAWLTGVVGLELSDRWGAFFELFGFSSERYRGPRDRNPPGRNHLRRQRTTPSSTHGSRDGSPLKGRTPSSGLVLRGDSGAGNGRADRSRGRGGESEARGASEASPARKVAPEPG